MTRLHCCGFIFTPTLWPTVVFLVLLPILLALGCWQLDRAAFKQAKAATIASRANLPPLSQKKLTAQYLNHSQTTADYRPLAYHRIVLFGHYDNQHQILLDNKIFNRRVGFDVLTPFILQNSQHAVLVNRGWIPKFTGKSQNHHLNHPTIKPVTEPQQIQGLIIPPPSKTFVLPHTPRAIHWPWVVQAIDNKKISAALGYPVYSFTILLAPDNTHGFAYRGFTNPISPQKHFGYAFQWFALALTLVIIYLVLNVRRGRDAP